jgi:hypothetical protein
MNLKVNSLRRSDTCRVCGEVTIGGVDQMKRSCWCAGAGQQGHEMPVTDLSRSERKAAGSLTREVMGTGIVREPAVRSHRSLGMGAALGIG